MEHVDVIVIGGGPAGLSAALVLGRCRRRTVLFDDGHARNDASRHAHGFFTRDGADPAELRRIGRAQLAPYPVEVRDEVVIDVEPRAGGHGGFVARTRSGEVHGTRLVLATGVVDVVPDVEGFAPLYGKSAWHCPHCDGWEHRDEPLAVLSRGRDGAELALAMQTWSEDLVLFTNGDRLDEDQREKLEREGVRWIADPIARLDGEDGQLRRVVLTGGHAVDRNGLFFHLGVRQRSPLPARLGCRFDAHGLVVPANHGEETEVPGLYVVGDASADATLIAVAVAEGAKAALHINKRLRQARLRPV